MVETKKKKKNAESKTETKRRASARFRASVVMPKQKRFNNAISNCRSANNRGNNEMSVLPQQLTLLLYLRAHCTDTQHTLGIQYCTIICCYSCFNDESRFSELAFILCAMLFYLFNDFQLL